MKEQKRGGIIHSGEAYGPLEGGGRGVNKVQSALCRHPAGKLQRWNMNLGRSEESVNLNLRFSHEVTVRKLKLCSYSYFLRFCTSVRVSTASKISLSS